MILQAPKKRGDCVGGLRPCPWVRCRYHIIWLRWRIFQRMTADEISDTLFKLDETCVLDIVDNNPGGCTLAKIGEVLGATRQLAYQILKGWAPAGKTGIFQKITRRIKEWPELNQQRQL